MWGDRPSAGERSPSGQQSALGRLPEGTALWVADSSDQATSVRRKSARRVLAVLSLTAHALVQEFVEGRSRTLGLRKKKRPMAPRPSIHGATDC